MDARFPWLNPSRFSGRPQTPAAQPRPERWCAGRSAKWLQQTNPILLESHALIRARGARILSKHGDGKPIELLCSSPVFGLAQQLSSDPVPLVLFGNHEIRNVSVPGLAVIIDLRMQMQKTGYDIAAQYRDQDDRILGLGVQRRLDDFAVRYAHSLGIAPCGRPECHH